MLVSTPTIFAIIIRGDGAAGHAKWIRTRGKGARRGAAAAEEILIEPVQLLGGEGGGNVPLNIAVYNWTPLPRQRK